MPDPASPAPADLTLDEVEQALAGDDELLTMAAAAKLFRVHPKTISRWLRRHQIRRLRTLGRQNRVLKSHLQQAVDRERAAGTDLD